MAVTENDLVASGTATDAAVFTTASISPSASRLVLAAIHSQIAFGAPAQPTLSGCSLTWVPVTSIAYNFNTSRLTVFRALGTPSTGTVSIDFAGVSQGTCQWAILEAIGVNTGGTNGSAAVVQSNSAAGSSATPSVTLSAFGSASNATFGFVGCNSSTAGIVAPGSGFTERQEVNTPGDFFDSISLESEWRADNSTTVNWALGASQQWGSIGIEVAAATGNTSVTPAFKAITVQTFTPTVGGNLTVTPPAGTVTLATFTPTVQTPIVDTPAFTAVSVQRFTPIVTASASGVFTPSPATITVQRFTPTVQTPVVASPAALALRLVTFPLTVAASHNDVGRVIGGTPRHYETSQTVRRYDEGVIRRYEQSNTVRRYS